MLVLTKAKVAMQYIYPHFETLQESMSGLYDLMEEKMWHMKIAKATFLMALNVRPVLLLDMKGAARKGAQPISLKVTSYLLWVDLFT